MHVQVHNDNTMQCIIVHTVYVKVCTEVCIEERQSNKYSVCVCACDTVCVCVCVCVRKGGGKEREERERGRHKNLDVKQP